MRRIISLLALLSVLSACGDQSLEEKPDPIGDFRLGFLVPTTSQNITKGPASRDATPEEWKDAIRGAFEPHFRRFEGETFYHIGVIVEGYVLAQPGIPVVLAPKSALIFSVTVIEDATRMRMTPEPHQITVIESLGASTVVGSGLVMSREDQLQDLAENAADQVEKWMREQPWFYDEPPVVAAAEDSDGDAEDLNADTADAGDEGPVEQASDEAPSQ
ncbi:MAG: hypothetical protein AAGI10_04895 [Pseudomonadota bacterium]